MGLFGSKKKTYVASTCYNMAGDEADRPDFLKSLVVGAALTQSPSASLAEAIRNGYANGPGMKIRHYYRWAQSSYKDAIGFTSSGMASAPDVSPAVVAAHIPVTPGKSISVQSVHVGPADLEVWAEQWMLENAYTSFNDDWTSDYDESTGQVVITMEDGTVHGFVPTDFSKEAVYISATYNEVTEGETLPTVTGSTIALATGAAFPSTSGWATDSFTSTPKTVPEPWNETHGVYSKTDLVGDADSVVVSSIKSVMYQDQGGHDGGAGHVVLDRTYRIDTTQTVVVGYSLLRVFIYRVGSGIAALDDQVTDTTGAVSGFLPPIPVRVDNHFLSESYLPDQYEVAGKAYKKLMGGSKFDKLIDSLTDNPNLSDLDYIYVVPGVSLNAADNSCKKYLYNFFAAAKGASLYGESDYSSWGSDIEANNVAMDIWNAWLDAQASYSDPLKGTPEPPRGAYSASASNEVQVKALAGGLSYDTRISWSSIKEDAGTGLSKPGAKPGDVWLVSGDSIFTPGSINGGILGLLAGGETSDLVIVWQLSSTSWKRLTIRGLVHRNYIYGGKYVEISAKEALEDTDESGFIVPIHYDTLVSMSARDSAQMTTACLFLVINSYQVVKQKWYQTGLFKIFAIVLIVVLSIVFPPAGLAGATALTIAAITLTNILISMILFKIVQTVAVELFGQKVGDIVAIVITFLSMNPELLTQNVGQSLAEFAQADKLLSLTSAVGRGVSDLNMIKAQEIAGKAQDILDDYQKISGEIEDLAAKNLNSSFSFDTMGLTGSSNASRFVVEPRSVFLARTLMTGSDIAALSQSMVSDFTTLTLNTELPV